MSEFDWGLGDTPRRSARISEKVKATPSPESDPPTKRSKKSSAAKNAGKVKEAIPEETLVEDAEMQKAEEVAKDNAAAETVGDEQVDKENETKVIAEDVGKKPEDEIHVKDGETAQASVEEPNPDEDVKATKDAEESKLAMSKEPMVNEAPNATKILGNDEEYKQEAQVPEELGQKPVEAEKEVQCGEQVKQVITTEEKIVDGEDKINVKNTKFEGEAAENGSYVSAGEIQP